MANKTVMEQLTSVGESALEQLAGSPVTRRALDSAVLLKDRVEKVLGDLVDVDGRIAALETRVAALEKARRSTTAKASASKPRAAAKATKSAEPKATKSAEPKAEAATTEATTEAAAEAVAHRD